MDLAEVILAAALSLGPQVDPPYSTATTPVLPVRTGYITSDYGERHDPLHGQRRFHDGIDIAASAGSAIYALSEGQVIFAGYHKGYGMVVGIRHRSDVTTLYAHCWALKVSVGDLVDAGTVIGFVGESGRATGPHLHFEVRVKGQAVDPLVVGYARLLTPHDRAR